MASLRLSVHSPGHYRTIALSRAVELERDACALSVMCGGTFGYCGGSKFGLRQSRLMCLPVRLGFRLVGHRRPHSTGTHKSIVLFHGDRQQVVVWRRLVVHRVLIVMVRGHFIAYRLIVSKHIDQPINPASDRSCRRAQTVHSSWTILCLGWTLDSTE